MLKLVHSRDGTILKEYTLQPGTVRIGRHPDCEISIDDATVSGLHAQITVKPSEYLEGSFDVRIEDNASTNGTRVNGKSVSNHMMKHDEVVRIGLHDLRLVDMATRAHETTQVILPDEAAG